MYIDELEKKCRFYAAAGMIETEKQLLREALSQWDQHPDWQWGAQRMLELDPTFALLIDAEVRPSTKEEIIRYSYQYQKEWRFEREKKLIEYALTLFPDWEYLHLRMEWHSRSIFHKDPERSKTQPRKPLHLPRDLQYIPNQETIDSMCFVTGASSNPPYLNLVVQLIESIKATRWYHHVPIKVLDCGLTEEDIAYLQDRFNVEVKDPGWDIDERFINKNLWQSNPNAFKGILARCFLDKHFPEYQYYFWVDADIWFQDERALDQVLYLCERQGAAGTQEYSHNLIWSYRGFNKNFFTPTLPTKFFEIMEGKTAIITNAFCFKKDIAILYAEAVIESLKEKPFSSGSDLSIFNYVFYRYIQDGVILKDHALNYNDKTRKGCLLDAHKYLMHPSINEYLGIVGLEEAKHFSYRVMIADRQAAVDIVDESFKNQERMFKENKPQGSYFYRIYPEPETFYGEMEIFLK